MSILETNSLELARLCDEITPKLVPCTNFLRIGDRLVRKEEGLNIEDSIIEVYSSFELLMKLVVDCNLSKEIKIAIDDKITLEFSDIKIEKKFSSVEELKLELQTILIICLKKLRGEF